MKIAVIGAGYVGLTTSCVLADKGNTVTCIDKDQRKLEKLAKGQVPFFEPGLQEVLDRTLANNKLTFTDQTVSAVKEADVVFIAVGTPPKATGEPDLTYIKTAIDDLASGISSYKTIVTKSTVPLGTNEWIYETLLEKAEPGLFEVVSNPEFLKEGTALYDTVHPDRVVIGAKSARGASVVKELFAFTNAPVYETTLTGAEMIKYASNVFLAVKISFINEIASICDAFHVNVKEVAEGIGADPRIGPAFLRSGLGYGGSCLPKDLSALLYSAAGKQVDAHLLPSAAKVNDQQVNRYTAKLEEDLGILKQKRIAVWGLSFKPDTDDTRHSPAILLILSLIEKGAEVLAFDPLVKEVEGIVSQHDLYESVKEADALILATEWAVFNSVDWNRVRSLMKGNIVLDARNVLNHRTVTEAGLTYRAIGSGRV
ncbi:UDP-glucose/GDP-mannose dehydrogenase family protein [Bacillus sp. H-16]|uniref:nucleotide sugar dehydrogenase n=1 Tax=Alteribacter salitolerans TaxID=2912333 RepID=UPI0019622CA9|nr:UDP-glucose/GDP-mannose dehydrogenase family protein [Alteribacter salitolerans]